MKLKPGYKQTEAGVIPQDWELKPMRAVLSKGRLGGNYANQDTEAEFPLMKMGNIARGYFDLKKIEFITRGVIPDSSHRLAYGDVLFNTRNTLDLVGKVAIWRDEIPLAYYNSNLMRLEFDADEICSKEYANYALNTAGAVARLRALATGTTSVAAIYTRDLMGLQFVLPPKEEQHAIAEVLGDVDQLLGGLDRLIAKKRDLKQAAMQQLLTGKTRLAGFKGAWTQITLGKVGRFLGGNGFPPKYQGHVVGDFPFFKVSDMNNKGNETFMRSANNWISEPVRDALNASVIPANSIVFAKVGAAVFLERKRILSQTSCIDNNMAALVVTSDQAHYRFVHFLLLQMKLGALVATTALPSLSSRQLSEIVISLPGVAEQEAIVTALSDIDSELLVLGRRREKTGELKQALIQQLLTGKTRLV